MWLTHGSCKTVAKVMVWPACPCLRGVSTTQPVLEKGRGLALGPGWAWGLWDGGGLGAPGSHSPVCFPSEELELALQDGQRCVRARLSLAEGLAWGPFYGSIQTRASSPERQEPVRS